MTAEIVSVGTELLLGHVVDTHAPTMARILAESGIGCTRRMTIGDNWDRLTETLRDAIDRADIVITIGGLGPTVDDLTRDAIGAVLESPLEIVPEVEKRLKDFFSSRNIPWNESIGRQAQKPTCASLIENPFGTAPGLDCRKNGKVVLALPGPKGEFNPMADGPVRRILSSLQGEGVIHSRTLRIIGMGESSVEALVRDLMDADRPSVAPYAHTGEVHLRLTAKAPTIAEADAIIDPVDAEIRSRLGNAVFGIDDQSIEDRVVALLRERGLKLAVCESMTGGELGGRITMTPGASDAFVGGVIVYSPESKSVLAEADSSAIKEFGPVSKETAESLAENIARILKADFGVSIVGNAGPTSDVDGKPVGLVYIGVHFKGQTRVDQSQYRGVREDIRRRACQQALLMIREEVLKLELV